jgi:hypothetical protein
MNKIFKVEETIQQIRREDHPQAAAPWRTRKIYPCRLRILMKKHLCFMTAMLYGHSILEDH